MSHPAWYYIKFLIIRGRHDDPKSDTAGAINETLIALKIPQIDGDVFDRLKATIKFPRKLMMHNKDHDTTIKFMKQERVHDIWNPVNGERGIFDFLQMSQPRETAQILLMGRLDYGEIAEKVTTRFRLPKQIEPRVIEMMSHYFWNVDILSTKEWDTVLWGDPRAASYSGAMHGPDHALFRAGFNPQVDGKMALKNALTHIHFRIDATRNLPDVKDTSDILSKLSKELKSLEEALSGGGQEISNIIKELRSFQMANTVMPVKTINDIIAAGGGSFSGQQDGGKTHATIDAEPGDGEVGGGSTPGDEEQAAEHGGQSDDDAD